MTASRECQLADGRVVVLRLAGPADVPAIAELYLGLSPESFTADSTPSSLHLRWWHSSPASGAALPA